MIKLIRGDSGGEMWVHESRLDEYLAAGHKLAAPPRPYSPKREAAAEGAPHQSPMATASPRGSRDGGAAAKRKKTTKAK